jgi:hypothetical protein
MVEATPRLHRRKPKDYRPALMSLALFYARAEIKDRIRAEGKKPGDYSHGEIVAQAKHLLMQDPEPLILKARVVIEKWIKEDKARAEARVARRTGHTLMQSVDTSPPSPEIAQ